MPNLFEIVLVAGVLWIAALWIWSTWTGRNTLEPFQVAATAAATAATATGTPEPLEWSQSTADKKARESQECIILQTFDDDELAQARVELMSDSCEGGLPHTVGTTAIRITEKVWSEASVERRNDILRHERVHLLQRRYPEEWEDFYQQKWGYRTALQPPANMPADVLEHTRGNPDTFPKRWACWRQRYWFIPVFTDCRNPNILNSTVRIWDATKRAWLSEPPAEWRLTFCGERGACPAQFEHPAEIAAEYWTNIEKWSGETKDSAPAAFALRSFIPSLL